MANKTLPILLLATLSVSPVATAGSLSYPVVDTGQTTSYDARRQIDSPKSVRDPFFGQDSNYRGRQPAYRNNGDGTISDLVTGLMWQRDPGEKMTWTNAKANASKCKVGGYEDWRLPSIKELYSLILFSGLDVDPNAQAAGSLKPFIDNRFFDFRYGDESKGERIIDSQFATTTKYVSTTMHGSETMFGVNFADGRIKGYGVFNPRLRREKTFHVLFVRGNEEYGKNDFHADGKGTVTDRATGLTWMQIDSGHLKAGPNGYGGMNWEQALEWAENLEYAGHDDWRLPNIKELQSILDYSRSPDTTKSAAIAPVFKVSVITNEDGREDYPYYWSGTTHARARGGMAAAYMAFGRSPGWMRSPHKPGEYQYLDVHGAGSQRSDPKTGDAKQFPHGRGPQGDVIRIENFVRCVRGGATEVDINPPEPVARPYSVSSSGKGKNGGGSQVIPPAPVPPRQGKSGAAENHFRRLDKNGDGKLTPIEFDGPPHHFPRMDSNRDGVVVIEEFRPGPGPGPPPHRRPLK